MSEDIRGRTGVSPFDPFGSLATFPIGFENTKPAQKVKAHRFASPSFDGFALSRMKGVAIQAMTFRLAPRLPPKPATSFAC